MAIKVAVNGAFGKMGVVTTAAIQAQPDFSLVASLGKQDSLAEMLAKTRPDVVIDFTIPSAVFANTQTILAAGARPVIGTTGLSPAQIEQLAATCQQQKRGAIIAPNFSLGAILMMRYAKDAARYYNHAEIVELHHEKKVDAPSGTALKTAQLMAEANAAFESPHAQDKARGDNHDNIQIHSVRLPGLFAHQMVMFGGPGELLTIRHDGADRNAMMPGVCLACRAVMQLDHLVYGLERILD